MGKNTAHGFRIFLAVKFTGKLCIGYNQYENILRKKREYDLREGSRLAVTPPAFSVQRA